MYKPQHKYDLPRIMFGVLFVSLMIVACLWVVRPFYSWIRMGQHDCYRNLACAH
ncbi:putative inner membrane protein [Hafnia alvei]|uniref:Putative inner membrane protein n=1 Tax=Hafnia alvei TaxID=569 RepID=A0A377PJL1_HAFAL|nr:putative inner membrane protein [Hafnia alvei]